MNDYFVVIAITALSSISGCSTKSGERGTAGIPTIDEVVYYRWAGMSPGGEFRRTSLEAIEVDLAGNRYRRITGTANAPEPMLPYRQADVTALLKDSEWTTISPEDAQHLSMIARGWMETHPPPTYAQPRLLGREDGYEEVLVVRMGGQSRSTRLESRGDLNDSLQPPPEWHALVAYLDALGVARRVPLFAH
jgi:hypothetical protein